MQTMGKAQKVLKDKDFWCDIHVHVVAAFCLHEDKELYKGITVFEANENLSIQMMSYTYRGWLGYHLWFALSICLS